MTVGVIGAGAFGTALAISLAQTQPVTRWARDTHQARKMQAARMNAQYLSSCVFPDILSVTSDFSDLSEHQTLLLAVPLQRLRGLLCDHANDLQNKVLVACCKGIELNTGTGSVQIIMDEVPTAVPAILTGPSFALDIARGLPTALTLACASPSTGQSLQQQLTTPNIRLYRTSDTIGAELGGALKNIIAIACGATIGAGLGDSARAALMTRGYAEMQRIAASFGAQPETLAGLSGFGDLALTCTSEQSRNYQLGLSIGLQTGFDPKITVEGAATARAVHKVATDRGLDMPITDVVVRLLDQTIDIRDALAMLLARPLREE